VNLKELKDDVRRHGVGRAIVRSAYYRARPSVGLRVFQLMVLEPEHVNRELATRRTEYEGRMLEPDDLGALARDPYDLAGFADDLDAGLSADTIATAMRRRHLCYALYHGNELASWGWYSPVACGVDRGALRVSFDPRYVYMFNGYTKPAHRGHNLHGIGLARALEALCARGWAGVVTLAERVNFASLRSAHRVGYRDCGLAVCARVGGAVRVWQSRGPERYGLRVKAGDSAALAGVPLDETTV
jgi:hypothetical protein